MMKFYSIFIALVICWLLSLDQIHSQSSLELRYNQLGYFPDQEKLISIVSNSNFTPLAFTVKDAVGNTVLTGTSGSINIWTDAGEYVSLADLSSLTSSGAFTFQAGNEQIEFNVGSNIYSSIARASLKYYYFNRASNEVSYTYGGVFAREAGHPDTQVLIHSSAQSPSRPTGTIISSPKGWYDAGDYNKYVVNSGISTYTLLAAYEHYPDYYESQTLNIPESGGQLPDILAEAKWNLDWLLTMQEPADGGVYHKLTGLNFSGIIMPEDYRAQRYVVGKSTSAALNFAAVMGIASRIYADFETVLPGYSEILLEAAQDAYSWAKSNPNALFTNPSGVFTGEYGDSNVSDEFQWAATELSITTGDSEYANDVTVSSIRNGIPSWQYVSPLALISIVFHSSSFTSSEVSSAKASLLATADALINNVSNSAMSIGMGVTNSDYVWGSNGVAANQVMVLIRAYEATNNSEYLNSAYTAMDYLFGRNGTGYSYVTGFGKKPSRNPHHRVSEADDVINPVPGMLVGGPNPGRQDGCSGYLSASKARSYVDDWCSYASNEVTINWNAPLAYSVNALHFYENGERSNVLGDDKSYLLEFSVYPNPTTGLVEISSQFEIDQLEVYDAVGNLVKSGNSLKLDLSSFPKGIYFVKVNVNDNIQVERIVRN